MNKITQYMDKGINLGGNIVFPELWIPYYDTSAFSTPAWNGRGVNRITVNNPYAKQNQGLQYWKTDGSTGFENSETNFLSKIQWVLDWTEIPEGERPFARCRCFCNGPDCQCTPGGYGSICQIRFFSGDVGTGNSCQSDCKFRIKFLANLN